MASRVDVALWRLIDRVEVELADWAARPALEARESLLHWYRILRLVVARGGGCGYTRPIASSALHGVLVWWG